MGLRLPEGRNICRSERAELSGSWRTHRPLSGDKSARSEAVNLFLTIDAQPDGLVRAGIWTTKFVANCPRYQPHFDRSSLGDGQFPWGLLEQRP